MRLDRPWMEAIEMQYRAFRAAAKFYASEPPRPPGDRGLMYLYDLKHGETFAWTPMPIAAITEAARSLPAEATLSSVTLPCPRGFWYFGPSHSITAMSFHIYGTPGVRASGEPVQPYVYLTTYQFGESTIPVIHDCYFWTLDRPMAEAIDLAISSDQRLRAKWGPQDPARHRVNLSLFLAGCVWLHQRVLVTSSGAIERHRRKQLARDFGVPLPSEVKVIELRRRESSGTQGDGEAVEWSCQWVVSGHWTHQAYGPKHGERRLQYVLPYVKGPADKPLRVPRQTVYVVDR